MRKIIFIFLFLFLSLTYLQMTGDIELEENKKINAYNKNTIVGKLEIKNTSFNAYLVENTNKDVALSLNVNHINSSNDYLIYADEKNHTCEISDELLNYLEKSYYKEHNLLTLTVEHQKVEYTIFSILQLPMNNQFLSLPLHEKLTFIKNNSLYLEDIVEDTSDILFLNTCYYPSISSYVLISAQKI